MSTPESAVDYAYRRYGILFGQWERQITTHEFAEALRRIILILKAAR